MYQALTEGIFLGKFYFHPFFSYFHPFSRQVRLSCPVAPQMPHLRPWTYSNADLSLVMLVLFLAPAGLPRFLKTTCGSRILSKGVSSTWSILDKILPQLGYPRQTCFSNLITKALLGDTEEASTWIWWIPTFRRSCGSLPAIEWPARSLISTGWLWESVILRTAQTPLTEEDTISKGHPLSLVFEFRTALFTLSLYFVE